MSHGFYFSRLEIRGKNKETAALVFKPGLNIVSGASNTGKSYAVECMRFILGGNKQPKRIKQSDGYEECVVECQTYSGATFQLARSLKGGDFELLDKDGKRVLGQQEVNDYLLTLTGFSGQKIKTNESNKLRDISYRDLRLLTIIEETKIIQSESPILTGQYVNKTSEEAVFRFLLSNTDDSSLKQKKEPKIIAAEASSKREVLESLIAKRKEKISSLRAEVEDQTVEEINSEINEYSESLTSLSKKLNDIDSRRRSLWTRMNEITSRLESISELLYRFNILRDQYDSDLGRLEFIGEGNHLLAQLSVSVCPHCSQKIDQHNTYSRCDEPESINFSEFEASRAAEASKIKAHKADLISTIAELEVEKKQKTELLRDLKENVQTLDAEIKKTLQPQVQERKSNLDHRYRLLVVARERDRLVEELIEFEKQVGGIEVSTKKDKKEKEKQTLYSASNLKKLSDEIQTLLKAWAFPGSDSVVFSEADLDLVIGGEKRSSFGKGYRAIAFSSFVIGLLNYCKIDSGLHPNHIVLDSPLTTYRGGDLKEKDKIDNAVENGFFGDLAKVDSTRQIIVFDNKEPEKDVREKVNYIHFSGKTGIGRYGFFPESE
ncbi:MAG: hypothetical protein A4S09_14095 [Proteobacteria bacterium SG_bin7]|nr:MAG: hypothetical protein A4S09_14095 [Proteobacteria bacterium SG_bin7]